MAVGTTAYPTSLDTVVELIEAANNSTTTLDGAIDNSVTTIPVVSTASFPSSGTISIDSEIISYTGKTGASFTGCTRGFESTSAASHLNGATVDGEITARHHNVLASALIAVETKLGSGTAIAVNKLAALTASRAVVTDGSGYLASATTTAAEIGYLAGVTTPTGSGALVLATSPTLTTPTIAKLANLTSNGFVKTSGGDGTLSVDTSTYLTANQTITLSGDVTGSGSTAITTTIANDAVTYAKLQNVSATSRILGRKTALAGDAEECTLSEILDFIGSAAQGDILYRGAASWERLGAGTNGHFLKTQGAAANPVWAAVSGGGLGDVVGPGSATDNAVVRFDSTTGKLVKNSVVTIADTTGNMAGVGTLNGHTIPVGTDTFVLLTANQTLTTKTLISPDINGGTADSLTSLSVRSTGAAFDLLFANTEVLTGNKTLTFTVNNTSRTVDLGGDLTLAAAFSTSGANALTLTTTGATNVTLPTTGTLVNSAVSSLSSLTTVGTITTGGLGTGAVLGGVTMTLGSDADGDMYYRASGVLTRLAKGTALQQLRMNAGATAPEWAAAAGGGLTIGTTAITSGTAGRFLYETSGNVVGEIAGSSADANGAVQFAATARSSGVAQYFRINTPADTGQTTATESVGAYFGGNGSGSTVTRTWANGAITTQRENVFVAPTYAFVSGSNTITTAATVAITGAPSAGSFGTITNPYALFVQEGGTKLVSSQTGAIPTLEINSSAASPQLWLSGGATAQPQIRWVQNASARAYAYWVHAQSELTINQSGTNQRGLIIDGSDRIGISVSPASAQLQIASQSSSRVGLRVDSAATPSVNIFQVTVNGGAGTGFVVTSTGAPSSPGAGASSERYGSGSTAAGSNSVAVGNGASAGHNDTVVIGQGASSSLAGDVVIGQGATAFALSAPSVVIGDGANAYGGGISIGRGATNAPGGVSSVIIGTDASAPGYSNAIVIGRNATATASNQFVAGSSSYPINDVFFGKGATNATPTAYAINGTGGSGSNIAGADVNLFAGKGTGTGIPGTIGMQFARAGSTGSSLNTLSDEWRASYSATDTVTLGANIKTSTTALTSAAAINALWTTATHASRTSALTFSTVNNAGSLTEIARFSGVAAVFNKGMVFAYVAKTGTYTAAVTDYVIDCTSGTFTVNLPPVSGLTGQTFIIKNSGTGVITLDGSGSETIDGATTQTITAGASLTIMCTGSAWIIL